MNEKVKKNMSVEFSKGHWNRPRDHRKYREGHDAIDWSKKRKKCSDSTKQI